MWKHQSVRYAIEFVSGRLTENTAVIIKPTPQLASLTEYGEYGTPKPLSLVNETHRPSNPERTAEPVRVRGRGIMDNEYLTSGRHANTLNSGVSPRYPRVVDIRGVLKTIHPQPRHPQRQQHQPPRHRRCGVTANPSPRAHPLRGSSWPFVVNHLFRHSCFGILSSFEFRNSSFPARAVPHSGHRSGLARRSYPQFKHNPFRLRRRNSNHLHPRFAGHASSNRRTNQ